MYRFDYETDVLEGALGAPHAIDIAYTFGNPDATALSGTRHDRHRVAARTSACWAAFARTGDPGTQDTTGWEPYDTARRATLFIDSSLAAVDDPDANEQRAWDGLNVSL